MTRGVVRDAVGEVGTNVLDPKDIDQQLRQLIRPRSHSLDPIDQLGGTEAAGKHLVLMPYRTDAGSGRCDYRLVWLEHVNEALDKCEGFLLVTRVDVHLPATGLGLRKLHRLTKPFEEPHGRLARVRKHCVRQAGDE